MIKLTGLIVTIFIITGPLLVAIGSIQTVSALKSHSSCTAKAFLDNTHYYTTECCDWDTDDKGNVVGTPKCSKNLCNDDTGLCKTYESARLKLNTPPSAGFEQGPVGSSNSSSITGGVAVGGGSSKSTTGSEVTNSNVSSAMPLRPPILKIPPPTTGNNDTLQ